MGLAPYTEAGKRPRFARSPSWTSKRVQVSEGRGILAAVDRHEARIRASSRAPVVSLERDVLDQVTRVRQLEPRRNDLTPASQKSQPPTELSTNHRNIP
jgi:hypothetical protein